MPYDWLDNLNEQTASCGGTLITCQHVLTARHCVTARKEHANAYGYRTFEILRPENVRVGLGSTTRIQVPEPNRLVFAVQLIKADENERRDLAVLVLRDAINPSWPNVRPVMIFSNASLGPMMPGDRFTAVGWGQVDENKPYCKFREKLLLS